MSDYSNYKFSEITGEIINSAYYVHNYLGFGFLESVYEKSLAKKLRNKGFKVNLQQPIIVNFKGEIVGDFKADLVINDKIIVELKAVDKMVKKHEVQLVNYLKATAIEVGLLINFGKSVMILPSISSTLSVGFKIPTSAILW